MFQCFKSCSVQFFLIHVVILEIRCNRAKRLLCTSLIANSYCVTRLKAPKCCTNPKKMRMSFANIIWEFSQKDLAVTFNSIVILTNLNSVAVSNAVSERQVILFGKGLSARYEPPDGNMGVMASGVTLTRNSAHPFYQRTTRLPG